MQRENSLPGADAGRERYFATLDRIMALVPAAVASVLIFGPRSLALAAFAVAAGVAGEFAGHRFFGRAGAADGLGAAADALLLALLLPVSAPWFAAALGGLCTAAARRLTDGTGKCALSPAAAAVSLLALIFPAQMSAWSRPFQYLHPELRAAFVSPPELLRQSAAAPDVFRLLIGARAGGLGETCILALLGGGIYLIARRRIDPLVPLCFLGTAALFSLCMGRSVPLDLLSGSLVLSAVFLAADPDVAPANRRGKLLFAAGCGGATLLLRRFFAVPAGDAAAVALAGLVRFGASKLRGRGKK